MSVPKRPRVWLALAGVIALLAGAWLGFKRIPLEPAAPPRAIQPSAWLPNPASPLSSQAGYLIVLPESPEVADFRLVQSDGQPLTREHLRGRWNFLYFGYTYCPDVCPLALAELNQFAQRLAQQGLDADTAYWFISVDPERDTPERLGQYVKYFNQKFRGATGDPQELAQLARQLRVLFHVPEHQPGEIYAVDHSSTIPVIDPDGRFHAIFMPPHHPKSMVEDFARLRAQYQAHRPVMQ